MDPKEEKLETSVKFHTQNRLKSKFHFLIIVLELNTMLWLSTVLKTLKVHSYKSYLEFLQKKFL